jgi:hypothetical protein
MVAAVEGAAADSPPQAKRKISHNIITQAANAAAH